MRTDAALTDQELIATLNAAAGGNQSAWNALVHHFAGMVWSQIRAYGLSSASAADVSQVTWLRLAQHLGRLGPPERVGAWLVQTARRECLAQIRRSRRQVPTHDERLRDQSTSMATTGKGGDCK
jgi:RNA polymerase sigma factor (sigma-70 family)